MTVIKTKPRPKTARKKPTEYEDNELTAFMNWMRCRHPTRFVYLFHPPNGGHRNKVTGAKLKRMGVKRGVPDVFYMEGRGCYSGLVVEFKATPPKDSVVSKEQREWIDRLRAQRFRAVVCKGFEAIKKEFEWYLSLPDNRTIEERDRVY
ncbi:VRR-NUC domain-containing protein [Kistimonas scapharcae]